MHLDHVTDGSRCWCKERVSVVFAGEKVGTAEISESGTVVMSITSDILAKKFQIGMIENLSISTTNKDKND